MDYDSGVASNHSVHLIISITVQDKYFRQELINVFPSIYAGIFTPKGPEQLGQYP